MTRYAAHGEPLPFCEFADVADIVGAGHNIWDPANWNTILAALGINHSTSKGDIITAELWNTILLRLHQTGHTGLPIERQP